MKVDKISTILIDGKPFSYHDERGIISFDNNVAMSHESGKRLLFKVKELFSVKDIRFCLAFGTLLGAIREHGYSFRLDEESYIDVYILRPFHFSIWGLWCYCLCDCATPKRFFKKYQKINFLGEDFLCPSNPEKLVEFWYGKDWRTPKSGKKYYYEVKSRYYWKYKGKYIKKLLSIFLGDKTESTWKFLKSIAGR